MNGHTLGVYLWNLKLQNLCYPRFNCRIERIKCRDPKLKVLNGKYEAKFEFPFVENYLEHLLLLLKVGQHFISFTLMKGLCSKCQSLNFLQWLIYHSDFMVDKLFTLVNPLSYYKQSCTITVSPKNSVSHIDDILFSIP